MNPTGTIEVGVTRLPQIAGPAAGPEPDPGTAAPCDCEGKRGCWLCSDCPDCDGNQNCDTCGGSQRCVTCRMAIMDDNRAEGVDTDECHYCHNRMPSREPAPAKTPTPGLDAAALADPDTLRALVGHWSMDELYTVGNLLMGEGDRRGAEELVDILRWMFLPDRDATGPDLRDVPKEPQDTSVVKVEFVTDSPHEDGVFWAAEEVYLHHANGDVSETETGPPEGVTDDDPFYAEWEEKVRRYEDLLADYARANTPSEGDHLIVDLTTGEFNQSGRWSLT
ncbi:hypothetical protein [Streptomyces virginiae]|uniref:hypothetical protein n=1 Tax=Streptomyces virginiae TaxID=1961 RepID=UPI003657A409